MKIVKSDSELERYALAAHIALMHIELIARHGGNVAALAAIEKIARDTQACAPRRDSLQRKIRCG
ncbi:hypothetical protein [Paraburkholderia sp. MM5384-R2]|uniref:hypothetical protein n=1 Tax=Paraburkholderia sp. MM5384-R2 TaxID=2723097 RepID=UPI0016218CBA|nr:hypothetical protein [Paraburkholderia sp. MM5384-R2]MBB5496880.1 hypothetical protein [Paraburkholderia sp. MM5384-R2]